MPPNLKSQKTPPATARGLALGMLLAILHKKQPLDEVWESQAQALANLEKRDQSFCRLLLLTVLRNKGFIEAQLDAFLGARAKLPIQVQLVMLLGVAQLLFLKTPAHAAISTSLELLARERKDLKGVANAVLRKIAGLNTDDSKPEENALQNIPHWLQQSWREAYGDETAKAICAASLQEPALDISVKNNTADGINNWAQQLKATLLPNGSLRLPHGTDVTQLPGFQEGEWWVQDAASALPVKCLGNVEGKRVFDLCAAPGGKTAQLVAAGAHVIALDRSKKRLQRLAENMRRLHMNVETQCGEALTFTSKEMADAVLLDAPCSATGTLRRHPDLMHVKTADDVTRLAKAQGELLRHAATLVKPGGLLLYAVCSLQPQEGPQLINAFLEEASGQWQRQPLNVAEWGTDAPSFAPFITPEGDLRTLPNHWRDHGGMDGFFAARLKKVD